YGNLTFPALVTPLDDRGQLDEKSTERLIDHMYACGMGGLYITGSTGEGVYLDPAIRRRIAEISVSMSRGRGHVVLHTGAIQGSIAYELAEHAGKMGVDAVASIPCFMGGYSHAEILEYYRRLGEASGKPVIAYCIPALTNQTFSISQLIDFLNVPGVG